MAVMASATQHDGDDTPGTCPAPPSPRPAIAKLARSAPSPILVHHRPQSSFFSPTCTHTTMTRLYEPNFGWLYRCTQDREFMIEDQMEKGRPVSFDLFGASFLDRKPAPSPRGPASRSDPLNFLTEITVDDLRTYTPQQIKTILEQREHVSLPVSPSCSGCHVSNWVQLHEVLERQQRLIPGRSYYYPSLGTRRKGDPPSGFGFPACASLPNVDKPWVVSEGMSASSSAVMPRASLSLDGIVKGDIPPTAISGFGFHLQGSRPLVDAEVVQNIGYRAVPWPNALIPAEDSTSSMWSSLMEMIDDDAVCTALPYEACTPTTPNTDAANTPDFAAAHLDYPTHNADAVTHSDWTAPRTLPDFLDLDLDAAGIENSADEPLLGSSTPRCRPSTPDRDAFLYEMPSPMMEAELVEGCFHEEPLEVVDGIAVTEEGVGLGVADVMAQV
ncbi:hypothetical protein PG987_014472 [Apiospora arundinis]